MKKTILFIFAIFLTMTVFSQALDYNTPLPENTTVKKGVLSNGMTYYIYPTKVVKDAASYFIITNAGSILENEDQKGLAHFLEHMAFNGTKNFPGKEVLNSLQKYGATFGRDINAHTAFDETVYNMNNIPTKDGGVDTALLILHDWANEISLIDKEIDNERGVILEEKRTRENGRYRLFLNGLNTQFVGTKYADRIPIGTEKILKTFDYKTLKDFYHDWYRTDLQAIAIIGDVNVEEVEGKIKKLFSKIPAVKNPKKRYLVTIPENKELLFYIGTDKEVSSSAINFSFHFNKNSEIETVEDLKNSLLNNIISSLLINRLNEASLKSNSSFLTAYADISGLSRTENYFSLTISPKPNKQEEAFEAVLKVINQAVKFGFTQSEIDRQIAAINNFYQIQISKESSFGHAQIEFYIQDNYLENKTFPNFNKEYEVSKNILENLTLKDIQNYLIKRYSKNNRTLLVTGVVGEENLTKAKALQIINDVENNQTLTRYVDEFSGKSLLEGIDIKPGKIISEKDNSEIDATTFTLSNGIKIHYKYYNKEVNSVDLLAFSFGGISLINDADLPSANSVNSVVNSSGVGDYSRSNLRKLLSGKSAYIDTNIENLKESIIGNSTTKDVETMLQLTYLSFVKPRFDKESFNLYIHNLQNDFEISKTNISMQMADSILVSLYGKHNPKKRIKDDNYIKEISFDKIKEIYLDRFKDPSNFEFFITGDIKKEALKPLLEKYIASLPVSNKKESWKDNSVNWLKSNLDKDIYIKMENPKTAVNIGFKNNIKWTPKNSKLTTLLKDILTLRYTATLREEEGGTYGAHLYALLEKRPKEQANLKIMFDCNPEKDEKLISIVYREIEKIKNGDINDDDFSKTITNYKKVLKERVGKNNFAQKLLFYYYIENLNINDPINSTTLINSLTKKDLQEFTNKFLNNSKSYEIVFKAKK